MSLTYQELIDLIETNPSGVREALELVKRQLAAYPDATEAELADALALSKADGSGATERIDVETLGAAISARQVDSVSALQSGSYPASLDRIWLSGYYGVGTAGGGPLYRDSADTTTADNGGTVFVDADGVRWKRVVSGKVSLADFGASGDGSDQTTEIQAALDYALSNGKGVFVPAGEYLVTTTLNMSKDQGGEGVSFVGEGQRVSTFRMGTGDTPFIDITGRRWVHFAHWQAFTPNDSTPPSTTGVYANRDDSANQAGQSYFEHLQIRCDTDTSANGGNGTVGFYNVAAEVQTLVSCYIAGDTGCVFAGNNIFSIASPYMATLAGSSSMTVVRYIGGTMYGITGPPLHLDGGADFRCMAYLASLASSFGATAPDYPVTVREWIGLDLNVDVEGHLGLIRLDGSLEGFDIKSYQNIDAAQPLIANFGSSNSFSDGNINIYPTGGTYGEAANIIDDRGIPLFVRSVWAKTLFMVVNMTDQGSRVGALTLISEKDRASGSVLSDAINLTMNASNRGSVVIHGNEGVLFANQSNGVEFDHRTNAGDPNGSVVPNFVGEELLDTNNSTWYKSVGTTNSDWNAIG